MAVDRRLRERREAIVRQLVEAVNAGDIAATTEVFDHPRFELIGLNRVYDGHEEVEQYLRERRTAFPDQRYELIALYHTDRAVIAEFWMLGTQLGEIEGLPPSGKAFRCRMATFFTFDDDRLTCQRIYFDVGTIARQLA